MERAKAKQNDLIRCLVTHEQDAMVITVIEIGQSSWLVASIVPGLDRNPLKKLSFERDQYLVELPVHIVHEMLAAQLTGEDHDPTASDMF